MDMSLKNKKLPKWFDGTHYSKGDIVTNPFSGESYELNGTELSMYDFLIGCSMTFDLHQDPQLIKDFDKGRDWFRKTNSRAYMVLLD